MSGWSGETNRWHTSFSHGTSAGVNLSSRNGRRAGHARLVKIILSGFPENQPSRRSKHQKVPIRFANAGQSLGIYSSSKPELLSDQLNESDWVRKIGLPQICSIGRMEGFGTDRSPVPVMITRRKQGKRDEHKPPYLTQRRMENITQIPTNKTTDVTVIAT